MYMSIILILCVRLYMYMYMHIRVHVLEYILTGLRISLEKYYVLCCSVIMVVGAGRGPLVDASLRAAYSVDRRVIPWSYYN